MRKQTFLALLLTFGLTSGGCAWFGGDSSSTEAAVTPAQPVETAEPAPAPEAPAPAKAGKKVDKKAAASAEKKQPVAKGAKTEAQIAAELDSVGRKLVAQAGRTVVPSKSKRTCNRSARTLWQAMSKWTKAPSLPNCAPARQASTLALCVTKKTFTNAVALPARLR